MKESITRILNTNLMVLNKFAADHRESLKVGLQLKGGFQFSEGSIQVLKEKIEQAAAEIEEIEKCLQWLSKIAE